MLTPSPFYLSAFCLIPIGCTTIYLSWHLLIYLFILHLITFVPIPAPFTEQDSSQIPSWTNGKVETDAWVETHALVAESDVHKLTNDKSDDGWDAFPINNWNIPEPSKPPSPPSTPPPHRPKPSYSKPTDPGHALLHWSFCRSYDCPYHRGHQSWYC
jgi:hypothetical protein